MNSLALTIDASTIALWTTLGVAFVGALGTLAGAAVKEYFTIRAQINELQRANASTTTAVAANTATAAAHDSTINSLVAQTAAIALATPQTPPAAPQPAVLPVSTVPVRISHTPDGATWQMIAPAPSPAVAPVDPKKAQA